MSCLSRWGTRGMICLYRKQSHKNIAQIELVHQKEEIGLYLVKRLLKRASNVDGRNGSAERLLTLHENYDTNKFWWERLKRTSRGTSERGEYETCCDWRRETWIWTWALWRWRNRLRKRASPSSSRKLWRKTNWSCRIRRFSYRNWRTFSMVLELDYD